MQTDCRKIATDVFCDVAEKTAFMFGDVCDVEELEFDPDQIRLVEMTFHGPLSGTLDLVVSVSTCRQVAANFTGIDADDDAIEPYCDDAIKELLNVTCGNILTEIAGSEPVFDLSVPTIAPIDPDRLRELLDDPRTVGLMVDEESIALVLNIEETE